MNQFEITMPPTSVRHLCVVEDNDLLREELVDSLSQSGFIVSDFFNGLDALAELEINRFDLILTDVDMPIMNGLELLRSVQTKQLGIPVMLTSGDVQYVKKNLYLEIGAVDFLLKPFHMTELLERLKRILGNA